jgi:hypothetical protein
VLSNAAGRSGGGIFAFLSLGAGLGLFSSNVSLNTAGSGGGVYVGLAAFLNATGMDFVANQAMFEGGAVLIEGSASFVVRARSSNRHSRFLRILPRVGHDVHTQPSASEWWCATDPGGGTACLLCVYLQ